MGKQTKKTEVTEKKTRNRKPMLESMLARVARAENVLAGIDAKQNIATQIIQKAEARLGRLGASRNVSVELSADIERFIREGFVPPKSTRTPKQPVFAHGTPVRIKDEYASKYGSLNSEIELHTMVYDFFDDVNRVAICRTDERLMIVRPKHLELRA